MHFMQVKKKGDEFLCWKCGQVHDLEEKCPAEEDIKKDTEDTCYCELDGYVGVGSN